MARPGYGEILRIEPFRWLWLSTLLARLGNAIAQVALPLLVYDKTGSARLLGLIFVLEFLPNVVLSPITGLLADRLDRRRLMIGAASLRAGAVALLPLSPQVWQIAVLAAVIAIGSTISFPAEFAVVPTTLDPVQLVSGLSLMQVTNSTMRVIGPPVGAALIGGFGPGGAFWTESVCFAASIFALLRLTIPSAPVRIASTSGKTLVGEALDEIAVGLRTVWRTPIVRGVTATESLFMLLSASLAIAGLVYVKETLDLGDRAGLVYGLLAAAASAGAVVGALLANRLERRAGRPALLAFGYLGPLLIIPSVLQPPLPVLFVCWFGFGLTDALAVIAMQAYLAQSVPDDLRGRVYATWNGVITLAALVTYGGVGWVTARIGAPAMLGSAGLIVGVGGPLLLVATGALQTVHAPAGRVPGAAEPDSRPTPQVQ